MTEHLKLWQSDAKALGIPDNMQRGLAFMAGIDKVIYGAPVSSEAMPTLFLRMSSRLRFNSQLHLPDDFGGDFRDYPISELLYELALQFDPEFTPRTITTPSGASFPSLKKSPDSRLPKLNRFNMANASQVARSLYSQIGDCIDESDIEAALVAGLRFFQSYHLVDNQNTIDMCRCALNIRPPHMSWISRCFLFELADLSDTNITRKVFDAFFDEQRADKFLCGEYYDTLRTLELTTEPASVDLDQFKYVCLTTARNFVKLPQLAEIVNPCLEKIDEEEGSLFSDDINDALEDLDADIARQWGFFQGTEPESDLSTGEKCDRICCIVWSALREALRRVQD